MTQGCAMIKERLDDEALIALRADIWYGLLQARQPWPMGIIAHVCDVWCCPEP